MVFICSKEGPAKDNGFSQVLGNVETGKHCCLPDCQIWKQSEACKESAVLQDLTPWRLHTDAMLQKSIL